MADDTDQLPELTDPDLPSEVIEAAADDGPARYGPSGPTLRRYAWASAVLDAHPDLLRPWATSTDRAIRRAVMRSPALTPEVADAVVSTRRTGMHTLGSNPRTPVELLEANPSARRRREQIDEVGPDADPATLVELSSPTIDLELASSNSLDESIATALARREHRPVDPWTLALLATRFGDSVWSAANDHSSARVRAARELTGAAAVAISRRTAPA